MATREQREAVIRYASRLVRGGGLGAFGARQANLPRLHHVTVTIHSHQLPAVLEFYKGIIGLKEISSPIKNTVWFEQGLHLYWGSSKDYPSAEASDHFALVVGNRYEEVRDKCAKLGLFYTEGSKYWDSPRCYVLDPANNLIELMEFSP